MRIKTAVARLPVADSGRYEPPSGILVDERASRFAVGRGRGNLYVLAEVSGERAGRGIIAMQLADAIRTTYYGWKGSVTAGLQEAIREANRLLFNDNRNALPGEQRTAGVSCAVLRDKNLFVAQAGPAAVYLSTQEGKAKRIPDQSPWLDDVALEEMDAAPLGDRRDINLSLFHTQVSEGDTILLVESDVARRVAASAWPRILHQTPVEAVLEALIETGKNNDLPALAIKLGVEGQEKIPTPPARPKGPEKAPKPKSQPLGEQVTLWTEQIRLGERLRTWGKGLVAILAGLWTALLTLLRRVMPGQLGSQPDSAKGIVITTKTSQARKERKVARKQDDSLQKILLGIAIAIPLIVAIVVLVTYLQRGQAQSAELETLWQEASTRWDQVQVSSDPAVVRTLLSEANLFLSQLLERQPDHIEAADLQKKVLARQDEINQVRRITWVAELKAYPSNADLSRIIVEGIHVFVMDRNAGEVYHHQMDEYQQSLKPESKDSVLVSKGDQVGNILVGDLVDMTWMPAGNDRQKANLLILESGGSLIEYDPTTGERVPLQVAGSERWQYPKLVGSYYGRFYLLDPTANQIWRYPPTPEGYSTLPDGWLQTEVDLAGVVDMAIGNSIYLLWADGKMRKFTAGQPEAFDISDWDTPPSNPTSLFTRPPENTQWVYVADRGNSRIVQASKEGSFRRQFQLAGEHTQDGNDPLGAVSSLFVDEISGHAYFLANQTLYVVVLPD